MAADESTGHHTSGTPTEKTKPGLAINVL
jgi:hypothetical protein